MFRVVFHPSSGAHNAVSTVSGIIETVTATRRERGWIGTGLGVCLNQFQPSPHLNQFQSSHVHDR